MEQMILLSQSIRQVNLVKFTVADMHRHLLGMMSTREKAAYYEYSHKIV